MNTRTLLTAGTIAGPVFVTVAGAQALTRTGFDLRRHPLSLLSLGELGWVQVANFVVCGLLVVAAALGARRVLRSGPGHRWAPRLLAAHGAGLILAGIFPADPSMGFPAGAPAGEPASYSWHSNLHGVGFGLAMLSLLAACIVLARRAVRQKDLGWATCCVVTALGVPAVLALGPVPFSLRAAAATLLTFAWVGALSVRLRRPATSRRSPRHRRAQEGFQRDVRV
jgi:hypothetical protein